MRDLKNYLYTKDPERLQIPYDEYVALMEGVEETKRLQQVKSTVVTDLQRFLDGGITMVESAPASESQVEPVPMSEDKAEPESTIEDQPEAESEPPEAQAPETEKVSVEFSAEEPESPKQPPGAQARTEISEVPPIKKEIVEHFNKFDESGRLFNVFKQYYTYLNEACGGTVRVTMKDGFCSLWNYDEWEEFAFVDIFEGLLRMTIDPRYTDALKSLSLCEAPRLISSRRNVICVQVDDLNNVVLDVLAKAFSEVGMQVR